MKHTDGENGRRDSGERQVRRLRRRLVRLLVLDRSCRFVAVAAFAAGSVVLALRTGLGFDRPGWFLAALAAAVAVAIVLAALRARREVPEEPEVRALLDRRQGHGGLLMAGAETDLGSWHGEMRFPELPRVRWRSGPAWALLLGSAAFAAVSFLVPPRSLEASTARPLDVGTEIAEIVESLEVLEEEALLEAGEADRLEEELEALAEEASGEDPARAWETLDHLREMAEQTAREAAEAALTEGESLAAAAEVAEALDNGGGPPELEADALAELAGLTARAGEESRLLDRGAAQALARAARSGDAGRMLEALGRGRENLGAKLDRLYQAGLIDLETLLEAKESLEANDAALAAYLAENGLEAAQGYCRLPGRGGVDRGRGDAEMTWEDPASSAGASFEEQVLDPAALAALRESGLIGLEVADPSSAGRLPADPAGGSRLDPAAAGGGTAHTHRVLPRHRGAVRRFFERSDGGSTSRPRKP